MQTPCYVFDFDKFEARANAIKKALGDIPLTYSIKANPFLLEHLPDSIEHVEVCSPGELDICENLNIPGERIIYSGVVKEEEDVHEALSIVGVDIITCESIKHARLIQAENVKVKTLLRLTSGNQFGMSYSDVEYIIANNENEFSNLDIIGIHFYSGTQKTLRKINKDFEKIEKALKALEEKTGFKPRMVEYGPGLTVEYFQDNNEELEMEHLEEAAVVLREFNEKYPLGIEMGRFLAAVTGTFVTRVCDIKNSMDTDYALVDGGIHHVNYFGQKMAMQVPPLSVVKDTKDMELQEILDSKQEASGDVPYCVCGSLCTVADVLIREAMLPELSIGDALCFDRCGAYSVTEAPALFLSRNMPSIYTKRNGSLELVRDTIKASEINIRK